MQNSLVMDRILTSDSLVYQSTNFHPRNKILPFIDFAQTGLLKMYKAAFLFSMRFGSQKIAKGTKQAQNLCKGA